MLQDRSFFVDGSVETFFFFWEKIINQWFKITYSLNSVSALFLLDIINFLEDIWYYIYYQPPINSYGIFRNIFINGKEYIISGMSFPSLPPRFSDSESHRLNLVERCICRANVITCFKIRVKGCSELVTEGIFFFLNNCSLK